MERFKFDATYGNGHGSRVVVDAFYAALQEIKPDRSILIPPKSKVKPDRDIGVQAGMMYDLLVGAVVPLCYDTLGAAQSADVLRALPLIEGMTTDEILAAGRHIRGRKDAETKEILNNLPQVATLRAVYDAINLEQPRASAASHHHGLLTIKEPWVLVGFIDTCVSVAGSSGSSGILGFRQAMQYVVEVALNYTGALDDRVAPEIEYLEPRFNRALDKLGTNAGTFAGQTIAKLFNRLSPDTSIRAGDDKGKNFDDVLWDLVNQTLEQL